MEALNRLAASVREHPVAAAGVAAGAVAAVALVRALRAGRRRAPQLDVPPAVAAKIAAVAATLASRQNAIAESLAEAIRLKTISFENPDGSHASVVTGGGSGGADGAPKKASSSSSCGCCGAGKAPVTDAVDAPLPDAVTQSRAAFLAFHELLAARYPRMHAALARTVVNECSLVYLWRGTDAAAPPVAFAAHMDVVPAADAASWTHPPFAGVVAEGHVWGRGAIDDKQAVVGLCEAVEALLEAGHAPSASVVLLFGHDEEVGGPDGAAAIAAALPGLLRAAGLPPRLAWLLDEGLMIFERFFPGVTEPVAVVCTAEKGHLNVELSVAQPACHSSAPPPSTSIGILAAAVTRLEAHPFPTRLEPAASGLLASLTPHMPLLPWRLVFANLWLFGPLVSRVLVANQRTAPLVRTTTAVDIIRGGSKSNVCPASATALVNHRIHPSESVASVLARDAAVIADPRVRLRPLEPLEPAPVSSDTGPGFLVVAAALKSVFGPACRAAAAAALGRQQLPHASAASDGVVVAPGIMVGNTDTKHYWGLTAGGSAVYRHCPTQLDLERVAMFHGRNERIEVGNLARIAAFYAACMLLADDAAPAPAPQQGA